MSTFVKESGGLQRSSIAITKSTPPRPPLSCLHSLHLSPTHPSHDPRKRKANQPSPEPSPHPSQSPNPRTASPASPPPQRPPPQPEAKPSIAQSPPPPTDSLYAPLHGGLFYAAPRRPATALKRAVRQEVKSPSWRAPSSFQGCGGQGVCHTLSSNLG